MPAVDGFELCCLISAFVYEILNHYTEKFIQESRGSVIIGLTKQDLEELSFPYDEKIVIQFHKIIHPDVNMVHA